MTLELGKIQQTKNTSAMVADTIRSAIMQGKLISGQSLKQDEIALELNVSKIPVREALVRLQAEGLVSMIPSKGATVSKLTQADVDEIYTMRKALEPLALRRAIPHLKPLDLVNISYILDTIDIEEDRTQWAELNWRFHEALYKPANMPKLLQVVEVLHNNVARVLSLELDQKYLEESQQQHHVILERCRQGDIDGACLALEKHLGDPMDFFAQNKHFASKTNR